MDRDRYIYKQLYYKMPLCSYRKRLPNVRNKTFVRIITLGVLYTVDRVIKYNKQVLLNTCDIVWKHNRGRPCSTIRAKFLCAWCHLSLTLLSLCKKERLQIAQSQRNMTRPVLVYDFNQIRRHFFFMPT